MSSTTHEKVVIIGAGAAGLTAAIYTARANLSPVILAGLQPGGQMTITTDVENYPGFADVIQGPWLMTEMQQQAENVGARVVYDIVTALDAGSRPFRLTLDSGDVMTADAVIVATGAQARWLGLDSEQAFNGRGVSACATCDGFFYRERDVAVIGGGNTAVEEALYLANICNSVTLIHRRDSLRAEQIMQDRLLRHEKIKVEWNRTVAEVLGDDSGVTGLGWPRRLARMICGSTCRGCSSPSGMIPRRPPSMARSISMMKAIFWLKPAAREPRSRVCSPLATASTRSTGRLSPRPAWDAWRRLTPKDGSASRPEPPPA